MRPAEYSVQALSASMPFLKFWIQELTKQFAVIGNPIEQSRSPELHHAFAEKTGVDLNYQKRLAPLDGFESSMRVSFAKGGSGMNVTVPF